MFLKRMRRRECVEMVLKTLTALFVGVIVAIAMEYMIYGIYLRNIPVVSSNTLISSSEYVLYCDENPKTDTYTIFINDEMDNWFVYKTNVTEQELDENYRFFSKEFRRPSMSELYLDTDHYIVIGAFLGIILIVYVGLFIAMLSAYKRLMRRYALTGRMFDSYD